MRKKIFLLIFTIIFVITIVTSGLWIKYRYDENQANAVLWLKSDAMLIRDYIWEQQNPDYVSMADKFGHELQVSVSFIDYSGKVLGDTNLSKNLMDNQLNRPEIKDALKKGFGKSIRNSDTFKVAYIFIAIPMGKDFGIVRISTPMMTLWEEIQKVWRTIFVVLLILFLTAAALTYRFSVIITIPLKEMTLISSHIAQGQFGQRIKIITRGRMGELSTVFNQMVEKLEQSLKQQKDKNNRLEAIIEAMANGMIVVDRQKRIIMLNASAKQMFQLNDSVLGFYIHEIIRSSELAKNVDQALEEDMLTTFEFHFNKSKSKILTIYITPMKEEDRITGAVVLIHDISELRKLEQMRSDFIANVSHELRTPLTSIKGFIETLQTGAIYDTDTALHFMDIINIEADRLARLINDILSLSELESRRRNFSTEKVPLNLIIDETMEIMRSHATDKSIDLQYILFDQKVWVKGSKDLLKQMMINLVDNAIKYTPSNGCVTIWIEVKDEKVYLHIKDTGIGIAPEHIPRLFERFYRVDKGRSRSLGGTGLGLAIVKHIVKSMDGDIKVKSKVGKGTEFIVSFRCKID